ncbi:single-stranded DNA-binding protein [Mycoplasma sp. 1573]
MFEFTLIGRVIDNPTVSNLQDNRKMAVFNVAVEDKYIVGNHKIYGFSNVCTFITNQIRQGDLVVVKGNVKQTFINYPNAQYMKISFVATNIRKLDLTLENNENLTNENENYWKQDYGYRRNNFEYGNESQREQEYDISTNTHIDNGYSTGENFKGKEPVLNWDELGFLD